MTPLQKHNQRVNHCRRVIASRLECVSVGIDLGADFPRRRGLSTRRYMPRRFDFHADAPPRRRITHSPAWRRAPITSWSACRLLEAIERWRAV